HRPEFRLRLADRLRRGADLVGVAQGPQVEGGNAVEAFLQPGRGGPVEGLLQHGAAGPVVLLHAALQSVPERLHRLHGGGEALRDAGQVVLFLPGRRGGGDEQHQREQAVAEVHRKPSAGNGQGDKRTRRRGAANGTGPPDGFDRPAPREYDGGWFGTG